MPCKATIKLVVELDEKYEDENKRMFVVDMLERLIIDAIINNKCIKGFEFDRPVFRKE